MERFLLTEWSPDGWVPRLDGRCMDGSDNLIIYEGYESGSDVECQNKTRYGLLRNGDAFKGDSGKSL